MQNKNSEQIVKKYFEEDLTLFNDKLFNKAILKKEFVEELLQVIFGDPKLKVLKYESQKTYNILKQRGIRLDCLCELFDGRKISVEVENNDNSSKWDDQKRVRYYGSVIDVMSLKKKEVYDNLPDLYMVYLTVKDIFGLGLTTYHIERCIKENMSFVNNGYHEIYINAENDDKSEIAEVMKMMSTKDYVNPKYKNIKKAKEEKLMPVEVREAIEDLRAESMAKGMHEGMQKGMAKGMQEGKIKTIIELLNQGLISEEVALSNLKLSKAELDQKIKELNL